MTTYKIVEDWKTFKEFIFKELENVDKNAVGFMYKDDQIYIRSNDEQIIKIINSKYDLILAEQPSNILEKDHGWAYLGNHHFFELKM